MGQSRSAELLAERDLANGGEVLDVDAVGQVGLVPFDFGQKRAVAKRMQGDHFAACEGSVAGVLPGTLKKGFAVADDVAGLDRLRALPPVGHKVPVRIVIALQ